MELERWLVTHKATGGVLSVVWEVGWFAARERAEQVHRDDCQAGELVLEVCPLFAIEKQRKHPYSAAQLAEILDKQLHRDLIVTSAEHATGVITAAARTVGGAFVKKKKPVIRKRKKKR